MGTGAGLGRVTELGGDTAHPRRFWLTLCPVKQGLCGHVLATQVLQRKDWVRPGLLKLPLQRFLSHRLELSGPAGIVLALHAEFSFQCSKQCLGFYSGALGLSLIYGVSKVCLS